MKVVTETGHPLALAPRERARMVARRAARRWWMNNRGRMRRAMNRLLTNSEERKRWKKIASVNRLT